MIDEYLKDLLLNSSVYTQQENNSTDFWPAC